MSRRRRSKETIASEFVVSSLAEKVGDMMTNRWMLMAPFPIPAMEIYQMWFTPEQHAAIAELRNTGMLKIARQLKLTGFKDRDGDEYAINVWMDEEHPFPPWGSRPCHMLSNAQLNAIVEWQPLWWKYKEETEELKAKVQRVGTQCKTFGQVVRIWPELAGFLNDYGRHKVDSALAKSPYPSNILRWKDGRSELESEFSPETLEPFTNMIAECLMLPEVDDLFHVGQVEY